MVSARLEELYPVEGDEEGERHEDADVNEPLNITADELDRTGETWMPTAPAGIDIVNEGIEEHHRPEVPRR